MSPEELNVRKAIADVELIRRVLDQAEQHESPAQTMELFGVTLTANIILQGIALSVSTLLLLIELLSRGALTEYLMLGAAFPDIRLVGIGLIAGILVSLVILLYFVIWRAARNSGEELNAYIIRNFRYARLLSYLSDLLLKFAAVALVMLAGRPEWIPPLLRATIWSRAGSLRCRPNWQSCSARSVLRPGSTSFWQRSRHCCRR